jgi:hypothetical protein
LPGPFQEQENIWNENILSDLEGTHPQGLTLTKFWSLGKPIHLLGTFPLHYRVQNHSIFLSNSAIFCFIFQVSLMLFA